MRAGRARVCKWGNGRKTQAASTLTAALSQNAGMVT